jgi:hypothetical protein
MKEIVLPTTGEFARIERIKLSDLMVCMALPNMYIALIERLVTIDGRKVDEAMLDALPLADSFLLLTLITEELKPAGLAKGVA